MPSGGKIQKNLSGSNQGGVGTKIPVLRNSYSFPTCPFKKVNVACLVVVKYKGFYRTEIRGGDGLEYESPYFEKFPLFLPLSI